ncbi:MAG TPA: group 1 truncated hemoglobin [Candidatus Acidoferrum sp.]|nr:group 1 truncated hemoglobin [Candidatus Acidoferrum sp.]
MSFVSLRTLRLGGALVLGLSLAACAENKMHEQSLYTRLGGKPAITAVVDQFVANVADDKRINSFFANADIPGLKGKLVDLICHGTGGPCTYTGKDMKAAHEGMGVKEADFNALVEDLVAALDKFKVPEKEKGELLGILGPMKNAIVEG